MKVLIIGLGSIAFKHIKVLREISENVKIFAYRSSRSSIVYEGITNIYEWNETALHNFDFGMICSPSSFHLEHIKQIIKLKIPIFVEKPLVINKKQISEFRKLNFNNVKTYVGCNFRFNPIIEFLKNDLKISSNGVNEVNCYCGSYLPNWRPEKDYRLVYSSIKKLGGGVHIDLIHEPDYLTYLFGFPLNSSVFNKKVSDLEIDSMDSSSIYLFYKNFQAHISLNYFRRDSKRTLEIVREKDTIFADFINGTVKELVTGKLLFKDENNSIDYTYKKQMKYFIDFIKNKNKNKNINSINEAISVLNFIV